jgi:hypothetical protein
MQAQFSDDLTSINTETPTLYNTVFDRNNIRIFPTRYAPRIFHWEGWGLTLEPHVIYI